MVLVVGSINMDISLQVNDIPRPGETVLSVGVVKNPGGKGANQAVAAAKMGADVTMLGCVGCDEHGDALIKSLSKAPVQTQYILRKENISSSSAYICVANSGENAIVVDPSANKYVSSEFLWENESLFEQAEYCVLQMEIPVDTVRTAIAICHRHHVKVVLNPSPMNGFDNSLLYGISYLISNETETSELLNKEFDSISERDIFSFMQEYRIENMIITLGKDGCCLYQQDSGIVRIRSVPKEAVDTTGAGDTFLGAFVAALSQNYGIKNALMFANAASGLSVTRSGAQQAMPTKQEVTYEVEKYYS